MANIVSDAVGIPCLQAGEDVNVRLPIKAVAATATLAAAMLLSFRECMPEIIKAWLSELLSKDRPSPP